MALTGFSTQPRASTVIDWRVSTRDKAGQRGQKERGGREGELCVCPPNNTENRWAIDTAQTKDEGESNRGCLVMEPGGQQVLNVYCFNLQ